MSLRLRFFVGEALSSLRNNFATTLAATTTVLIVLFWLGVFVALGSYMYSKLEQVRQDVKVSVYLADNATARQVGDLQQRLRVNPAVARIEFLSKRDALRRYKRTLGENADLLKAVPGFSLPRSFEVKLRDPDRAKAVARSMVGLPGVEKGPDGVRYGGEEADRLLRNAAIIEGVIGGLILLLAIAAVLLIANTIRLSIFARRREIEVMKLVGATNWFVRGPFMLEGLICGVAGSLLAVLLLFVSKEAALPSILPRLASDPDVQALSFPLNALILLGIGLMLGAAGSGLTLRRFLRV